MLSSTPSKGKNPVKVVPIEEEINLIEKYEEDERNAEHYIDKIKEISNKQDVLHQFLSNLRHMVHQEEDEVEHRRSTGR